MTDTATLPPDRAGREELVAAVYRRRRSLAPLAAGLLVLVVVLLLLQCDRLLARMARGTYRATIRDRPKRVTSLVFLDFSQLLGLGERTGLNASRSYLAARNDLRRIRALGASTSGGGTESTTELRLQIS